MEKTNSSILKTLVLASSFFILTPITIIVSLFSIMLLNPRHQTQEVLADSTSADIQQYNGVSLYASLPADFPTVSGSATAQDARVEVLSEYFKAYDSPLLPFAQKIVTEADKNQVDFRLITAIAQQESNLCKRIPPNSYNCWGWGIHSRGTLGFSSYEEGIETVTQGLKEKYLDEGYTTVEEIMGKYTPLSPGSWAIGVNTFMNEMQ